MLWKHDNRDLCVFGMCGNASVGLRSQSENCHICSKKIKFVLSPCF